MNVEYKNRNKVLQILYKEWFNKQKPHKAYRTADWELPTGISIDWLTRFLQTLIIKAKVYPSDIIFLSFMASLLF